MAETCATELLDEALQVGARELDALRAGDVDLASELCERRAGILWNGDGPGGKTIAENCAPVSSRSAICKNFSLRKDAP